MKLTLKKNKTNEIMPAFTTPATALSRGKSSALIKKVCDTNENLLIIKNSEPYAVVLSYKKYIDLIKSNQNGGKE